jgi:2-amino-4-hydroxy-6-hydroxymethyldihydropteridine diphosphokinase
MLKLNALAYIGLGSNSGESQLILKQALDQLAALPSTKLTKSSKIYLTEPQEEHEQAWFYNQAAAISTTLSPEDLLRALQSIETALGRNRDPARRYGPRTIDLDILIYGQIIVNTPDLVLPHPRLSKRAFALIPLMEIVSKNIWKALDTDLKKINYKLDGNRIFQS